jgi:hypothetical protein
MEDSGEITIVCDEFTKVKGSYTISPEDGRICVAAGWKEVMEKECFLKIGDKMFFMLYVGSAGPFIFAYLVPHIEVE